MVDLTGKESSLIITKTTTTTAANNSAGQDIRAKSGVGWKGDGGREGWGTSRGKDETNTDAYLRVRSEVAALVGGMLLLVVVVVVPGALAWRSWS